MKLRVVAFCFKLVWTILLSSIHVRNGYRVDAFKCFFNNAKSPFGTSLRVSDNDNDNETKKLIEAQQLQIERLMGIVSQKLPIEDASISTNPSAAPLKVMLFIDGTWLYYSLHKREYERNPIQQAFGPGWQVNYNIDWVNLPRIIGKALQEQDKTRGWMPLSPTGEVQARPVEITRVSVYTSFRGDTAKTSIRYQMFQDMIDAKYDVLMLETMGSNEKCIDIQLAVDMLHYATVPDAYDVALLLTGDKDFIPAMVRSRQKGRRVGLVTMRSHSSRSFVETPNISDYDVIYLDDHIKSIIKPRSNGAHLQGNRPKQLIGESTIMTIIADFITCSGEDLVISNDIGTYLKSIHIGDRSVLDEVREIYGGLYQFLVVTNIFILKMTPKMHYRVGLNRDKANKAIPQACADYQLSQAEKIFFDTYSLEKLSEKSKYYGRTMRWIENTNSENSVPTKEETEKVDYNSETVAQLKVRCKSHGLKVSGKKAELVERLKNHDMSTIETSTTASGQDNRFEYLEGLLMEYLQASGGEASSRDVGRYLSANKPSTRTVPNVKTALVELKSFYGNLGLFIQQSDKVSAKDNAEGARFEFTVFSTST